MKAILTVGTGLVALTLVTLAAASPALAGNVYDQAVLADNPLAYFQLDSVNEPSAVNGFTTTFNGGLGVTATGSGAPIASDPNNVAAAFNGTLDPSGFGSGPSIGTNIGSADPTSAGSILGWFSLAQLPNTNNTAGIYYLAGRSASGNDLDVQIQQQGTGDNLYLYTAAGANINAPIPNLALNTYYFFAATEDPTTQASALYIDGSLVASGSGGVSGTPHTSEFTIGDSSVFTPRNFDGKIDDVALYNYALTSTQVQGIYAAASFTPPPPVTAVPEGSSLALLALGLLPVGLLARRRKTAA